MSRRLLAPALSAVLALAVAVPATWYVATTRAGAEPAPALPTGPPDRDALRAQLLEQLPGGDVDGAVTLEAPYDSETAAGLPPGRYRVHLICGLLRRQGERPAEVGFFLAVPGRTRRLAVPCPSTPLVVPEPLDFTRDPAGAVSLLPEFTEQRPGSFLLLLRIVPVDGS